jgi:hypothetical protein
MRTGTKRSAIIGAVARHFSATIGHEAEPAGAILRIGGRSFALEVVTMPSPVRSRSGGGKPRLRFDRVALGSIARLRASLQPWVPDRSTIVVTMTAPIRLPSKTTAAIEQKARALLAKRGAPAGVRAMIHGNAVQVRILPGGTSRTSKVIGFVHNPDSDPRVLLELIRRLLLCTGSARGPAAGFAGERWLVITDRNGLLPVETHRHFCSQLGLGSAFARLLVMLPGGRIESLR